MTRLTQRLAATALCVIVALLPLAASAGDTLRRVIDFKTLNVGMTADQPPLNTVNRSGNLMGFDVDLARALASAMQVKLEIKIMPFGELMKALENDEIDMIISGMAITPERSEEVSFVGPYMMSGKSILTRDSVLARITEAGEANRKDLTLLALKNSTSADFVSQYAPEAKLVEINNYDEGIQRVVNGKADGLVADMPICALSVLRYPDQGLVTLQRPLSVEPIGIAIGKDDPQFHNLVDNYLDAYSKMGTLTKLRKKWLEEKDWIAQLP
jgi:ABC-type amino acid transport substrate-binding protein